MKVSSTCQSSIPGLLVARWLLCLSFLVPTGLLANQEAPVSHKTSVSRTEKSEPVFSFSGKKILKRFAEKRIKGIGKQNPDKQLSKLARAALYCFIGIFALGLLGSLATVLIFSYLSSAAFIATIVLCVLVLIDEDQNQRSRSLAKALLIVLGVLTLLSVVMLALLLAAFAG